MRRSDFYCHANNSSDLQFIRKRGRVEAADGATLLAFAGLRQLSAVLKGARGNRVTPLLSQAFSFKEPF